MGRVLLVDGSARRDGVPLVLPRGAWRPAWPTGLTRANAYAQAALAGDGGVLRVLQRPEAPYGAPFLPPADALEFAYPLREEGKRGLVFQGERVQVLATASWDFYNIWNNSSSTIGTGGKTGPTGRSSGIDQAYEFASTANGGFKYRDFTLPANANTVGYVFSCWIRTTSSTATGAVEFWVSGSNVALTYAINTKWRRIWTYSPSVASTAAQIRVYPSFSSTATVQVWGPQVESVPGSSGGNANLSRSLTMYPSQTRGIMYLDGPVRWSPAPWTMFLHWRAFYDDGDSLLHGILEGIEQSTSVLRVVKSAANNLEVRLYNAGKSNVTASTATSLAHDLDRRLVAIAGKDGSLKCYLNGTAFTTQVAAAGAWAKRHPTSLSLGTAAGSNYLDGEVHRMELWDEALPPERFF